MIVNNFWTTTPEQAARQAKETCAQQVRETLAWADEICENRFMFRGHWEMERTHKPVAFQHNINWEHVENNDPEWTYAFNRHSIFVVLGKAWRYTGKESYAKTLLRLWDDWLENVPFTEHSKTTTWRSIEAGIRCENWLRVLSLLENCPLLDQEFQNRVQQSLEIHAQWLVEAHRPFQILSNWGVLQDHGLFLLGLALQEPAWCELAVQRLVQQARVQIMGDGTHWEQSPLYHCEVLHCFLDTLLAAKRNGYDLPKALLIKVEDMSVALASLVRPDGLLICQGDSDEVGARDLLALAAFLFENPVLKSAAAGQLYEENLWDFCDLQEGYAELAMQPFGGSVMLQDSGNAMLWSGTGENAGFMHFFCGCLGSGHGHADLLHVDLVVGGESILIDSGRYTYMDTPLRKQLKSAQAHNTVRVDNQEFTELVGSWGCSRIAEPLKGNHRFTPHADYVTGAHMGYLHLGVLHRRHLLRLGEGLWVIWDAFHMSDFRQHHFEHSLHFGIDGQALLNQDENVVLYKGKRSCATVLFCGAEAELSSSSFPASREYNLLEQSDCIKAYHRGARFTGLVTIVAAQQGQQCPALQAQMVPVSLLASGKILEPHIAQGVSIIHNGEETTLILCHNEVISEVDLFTANGKYGYGKVLLFDARHPEGLCLQW